MSRPRASAGTLVRVGQWTDMRTRRRSAILLRGLACVLFCLGWLNAWAQAPQWLHIPTREGVTVRVFWAPQAQARATLFMLPGGAGGIGKAGDDGWPDGQNFLIRTGKQFAAHGYNIAMVSRASDQNDLDYATRIGSEHLQDLHTVLTRVQALSSAPIWIVGTSRGTVSATAMAIAERDNPAIGGVVLTSSVVSWRKPGAVPRQALGRIEVPVLVVHHRHDACVVCNPAEVPAILDGLKASPRKALIWMDGGEPRDGDTCGPWHHHGYSGIEDETVDTIARWIAAPM